MRNLLKKEEVLLLEKAVDWNISALGILTNAIFRPISFLTGSIKKGLNKQQINILVKQWGLEYVNAIKKVDTNENKSSDENETIIDNTFTENDLSPETKEKTLLSIEKYNKELLLIKKLLVPVVSWTAIDKKDVEYKKLRESIKLEKIDNMYLKTILDKNPIKNTETYIKDIEVINTFLTNLSKSETIQEYLNIFQNISKFIPNIKGVLIAIDNLLDIHEIVSSELKKEELGTNTEITDKEYKIGDAVKYTKKDGSVADAIVDDQTDIDTDLIKIKTKNSTFVVKKSQIIKESYFINEAVDAYKLPDNVTSLLSQEDINRLKENPNIKEEVTKALNFERLNTIAYEANFLINKLKEDDKRKSEATELQRIWDLGVQNTNDYFQDLVNVDKVKNQVKGTVDSNTKQMIEEDQNKLDNYQKMGISEVFSVGAKFDIKKLYAFDAILTGQNNKVKKVILLLSPTSDFVEDISGEKHFWFKMFGAYSWDTKTSKIVRTNPFNNMSQNPQLVSSLMTEGDSVYISSKMLRPSPNSSFMYIYDNKGRYFYGTKKYANVQDISTDILKYKKNDLNKSIKEIAKVSNIMSMKIIQRFIIDNDNINSNKYPGISMENLNKDRSIDIAKSNHDKLINLLGV